jgi:hypothetical protein
MSEVRISLSNGRTLEWSGSSEQGRCIINAIESVASKGGATFDAFTHSCIKHAMQDAALAGEVPEPLLLGIVALVLQSNTENQEHPGRIIDYLDNTDFKINFVDKGKSFVMDVNATSRFDS